VGRGGAGSVTWRVRRLSRREQKELERREKQRLKQERQLRREKKRRRLQQCVYERMNCFSHDNSHWKTAPFWTEGPFCFCMNANNNTYSCLRTINATHNFLYCEFVTGLITFYNLRIDPFEQWNRVHSLSPEELSYLHDTLIQLKACKGTRQCTVGSAAPTPAHSPEQPIAQLQAQRSVPDPLAYGQHSNRSKKKKFATHSASLYSPPAMHIVGEAHVLPPHMRKHGKKLAKIITRKLNVIKIKLNLIGIYAPVEGSDEESTKFYHLLQTVVGPGEGVKPGKNTGVRFNGKGDGASGNSTRTTVRTTTSDNTTSSPVSESPPQHRFSEPAGRRKGETPRLRHRSHSELPLESAT
ncbi:Uncharacterized protein GBIM_06243, partial [Gryllus bimaculatus]